MGPVLVPHPQVADRDRRVAQAPQPEDPVDVGRNQVHPFLLAGDLVPHPGKQLVPDLLERDRPGVGALSLEPLGGVLERPRAGVQ